MSISTSVAVAVLAATLTACAGACCRERADEAAVSGPRTSSASAETDLRMHGPVPTEGGGDVRLRGRRGSDCVAFGMEDHGSFVSFSASHAGQIKDAKRDVEWRREIRAVYATCRPGWCTVGVGKRSYSDKEWIIVGEAGYATREACEVGVREALESEEGATSSISVARPEQIR